MRTYLSPVGFNSTTVTRAVLSHGIDTGDRIVLLRPEQEANGSRGEEAIEDVRRLLTEIEPEVDLCVERIPHDEFETAVLAAHEVLQAVNGECIVNLGGGARDILLPFAVAVLSSPNVVDEVLFFSDIDGRVRQWQLPRLTATVSDATRQTLSVIDEMGGTSTIPTLTEATDRSKSTIARHIDALESVKAVRTFRDGKTKHVTLTLTGRLLLAAE
jgi:CRISPR-associated protein Csa3